MAARLPEPSRASFGKDFYSKSIERWLPGRRSRPGPVLVRISIRKDQMPAITNARSISIILSPIVRSSKSADALSALTFCLRTIPDVTSALSISMVL